MEFSLNYYGGMADDHRLDFYDASRAMMGFERTLALTAHLVINDEIITQVTALKGASILMGPMEAGSLKIPAYIVAGATSMFALGTLESDNPLGHMIYSAYDAMVHAALGVDLDYDKPLRKHMKKKEAPSRIYLPSDPRIQSLVEKCEVPLAEMHRPITVSESAHTAEVVQNRQRSPARPAGPPLSQETFDFLKYVEKDVKPSTTAGKVASYNLNSFKGRMFCLREGRLISFVLDESCRSRSNVRKIVGSLQANAVDENDDKAIVNFHVIAERRRTGSIRSYRILDIGK